MLELNHMLTVLQAFLPQYWNWTHWPNKVEIFCLLLPLPYNFQAWGWGLDF